MTTAVNSYQARSPGKVILSGEHSVVYGAPALALAVQQYTTVSFSPMLKAKGLHTSFDDVSQGNFYPLDLLKSFKRGLDKRFEAFKSNHIGVREILEHRDDLAIYSMATLLSYMPMPGLGGKSRLPRPGLLRSRSTIPTGAGMGSSAAVIAATAVLYEHLLGHEQTDAERFERVRFCERLQHGQGSAIDAASVVYGGINRVVSGEIERLDTPVSFQSSGSGWYWCFHGTPESTTGECVAQVSKQYKEDNALWKRFEQCTDSLQQVLLDDTNPIDTIRENHQLLTHIGVVPEAVQSLVSDIEQLGGAAKISGAGAVRGDAGGIVLLYLPDQDSKNELQEKHPSLEWQSLKMSSTGAQLLPAVEHSLVEFDGLNAEQ